MTAPIGARCSPADSLSRLRCLGLRPARRRSHHVRFDYRRPGFTAGFASLDAESDTAALAVIRTIPAWLRGALLRNGPALFDASQRSFRDWFDGQAVRTLPTDPRTGDLINVVSAFGRRSEYRATSQRGTLAREVIAAAPASAPATSTASQ